MRVVIFIKNITVFCYFFDQKGIGFENFEKLSVHMFYTKNGRNQSSGFLYSTAYRQTFWKTHFWSSKGLQNGYFYKNLNLGFITTIILSLHYIIDGTWALLQATIRHTRRLSRLAWRLIPLRLKRCVWRGASDTHHLSGLPLFTWHKCLPVLLTSGISRSCSCGVGHSYKIVLLERPWGRVEGGRGKYYVVILTWNAPPISIYPHQPLFGGGRQTAQACQKLPQQSVPKRVINLF